MRRVAVILNAGVAGAQALADALRREVPGAAVTVTVTRSLTEARQALYQAVDRDVEAVLLGGGDGTFAMGLSLLAEACRGRRHPAVGVLRLGTGNAFARARGVQGGLDGHRQQLRRALSREHALGSFRAVEAVGVLAPFCGFGVDAQLIADHAAAPRLAGASALLGRRGVGALRYALAIATRSIPRMALTSRPRVEIHNLGEPAQRLNADGAASGPPIAAGERLWAGPCTMAAAATIPCFGFGLQMFPFATQRDDRFQLRASDAGLLEILRNTRAAFRGTYTSPNVHDFLATRVAITMSTPAPFEAGGEAMGELGQVEIRLGPPVPLV